MMNWAYLTIARVEKMNEQGWIFPARCGAVDYVIRETTAKDSKVLTMLRRKNDTRRCTYPEQAQEGN